VLTFQLSLEVQLFRSSKGLRNFFIGVAKHRFDDRKICGIAVAGPAYVVDRMITTRLKYA
jgi:hypothetical protein